MEVSFFSENSSTQTPVGTLQKIPRAAFFPSFSISLLVGIHRVPCKSFFALWACPLERTERTGLRRGTCSTVGKTKKKHILETGTRGNVPADSEKNGKPETFEKLLPYLEYKNSTVTVIFLLWNALENHINKTRV